MILVLVAAVRNLRIVTEEIPKAKRYEAAQSLVILALRFFIGFFLGECLPQFLTQEEIKSLTHCPEWIADLQKESFSQAQTPQTLFFFIQELCIGMLSASSSLKIHRCFRHLHFLFSSNLFITSNLYIYQLKSVILFLKQDLEEDGKISLLSVTDNFTAFGQLSECRTTVH